MSRINWIFRPVLLVAILLLVIVGPVTRAEMQVDPPRSQTAAGYTVELIAPDAQGNHSTDELVAVRLSVKDAKGQPVSGLNLNLTAVRDYSGQVKHEHNGPRVSNIGPLSLTPTTQPGQYETSLRFGINGHWLLQIGGPSLANETVSFRTPVGALDDNGSGFNFDWLLWPGIVLTVLLIVVVTWRKGEVFPTPTDELQPPVPAPSETELFAPEAELSVSGTNKL